MAKKLNSVLGIDIGSQRIKVCEMKTQGREPVVTALGIIDTPEGAVDHTGVYNSDAVGAALKQIIADSGATTASAVVTIAGQASVLIRTLEVPRMNPAELKDHMAWEINRNIPFAESTVVSDFKPLGGDDPNSPNMDVVMAIAPQSAIDTIMACLKRAGRQTAAIDVEPLSIARTLQTSYDDLNDKTVCVVEMGHKTTSINIYRGSKLLMPRQVPLGGEMFTKAIADALTTSMPEAERIKQEKCEIPASVIESAGQQGTNFSAFGGPDFQSYNPFADDFSVPSYSTDTPPAATPTGQYDAGVIDPSQTPSYSHITDPYGVGQDDPAQVPPAQATPDQTQVVPAADYTPVPSQDPEAMRLYTAIAPVLEELISEVRRSIDYYRSRGGEVDVVELCGGGTRLKGLAPYVQAALHIQCDAFDPLRRLNMNIRKVPPAFVDEHRQEFAVAVGNGLHIFFD